MYNKVKAYMEEFQMVNENDTVVVGVSGGADSVCLFLLLHEYCRQKNVRLVAVHVNHLIREDAAADAMVKATGDRWSYYMSAEEYEAQREQSENAYVGVGITIQQQPHQGFVGFFIGKQGGEPLVDDQGFQGQHQLTLGLQFVEAVAEPGAGENPLGAL